MKKDKKNKRILFIIIAIMIIILLLFGLKSCSTNDFKPQEKKDYLSYVKGLKNWKIQEGTKNLDFMDGISWNKDEIKKVTVNDKGVDPSKTGSYDIVYTIDIKDEDEKDIKKTYTVSVVEKTNKEDSKKEPSKTDDKKTDESKKEESVKPVENKPSSDKDSKPSTTDNEPSVNNTSKPEVSKPSKPSHKHEWVNITKTIHHKEQGHYDKVCIKDAWDEQIPKYEMIERSICNGCGVDITNDPWGHIENSVVNGGNCGGYHSEWKQVLVGYNTVHHEAQYEDRWVVDKPTWTETVVVGQKCICGAKK